MRGTGMHREGRSFTGMVLSAKDKRIAELEAGEKRLREWSDYYRAQWLGAQAVPPVEPPPPAPEVQPGACLVERIAELEAERDRLREALQSLYDEQNGPPLKRRETQWMRVMGRAREVLGEWESAYCKCGHPLEGVRPGKFQPQGCCAGVERLREALKRLEYWFDTDPEVLAAMDADTLADHQRQLAMIRAALQEGE